MPKTKKDDGAPTEEELLEEEQADSEEYQEAVLEAILKEGKHVGGDPLTNLGAEAFSGDYELPPLEEEKEVEEEGEEPEEEPADGKAVRFNNLKEAEKETRKLQSERDKLTAEVASLKAGGSKLEPAMELLADMEKDPELLKGIKYYYQHGSFKDTKPAAVATGEPYYEDDYLEENNAEGTPTAGSVSELVEQKVAERLEVQDTERRQREWYEHQKKVFHEAYPNATEDDWKKVNEFARDPENLNFKNLWTLMNIEDIIEDAAKNLAERRFKGKQRPSATAAAGAARETPPASDEEAVLKSIMQEGRRGVGLF